MSEITVHHESLTMKPCGFIISTVYRPPSGRLTDFIQFTSSLLEYASVLCMPIALIVPLSFNISLAVPSSQTVLFLAVINHCTVPTLSTYQSE